MKPQFFSSSTLRDFGTFFHPAQDGHPGESTARRINVSRERDKHSKITATANPV